MEGDVAMDALRAVAVELVPDVPRLAREVTDHLFRLVPELTADDDTLVAETLASSAANLEEVLRQLGAEPELDAPALAPAISGWPRGLVRRGIPLPALLRSYRLGHEWAWSRLSTAVAGRIDDPGALLAAREYLSDFLFAYIDRTSDALVETYGTERERLLRSADQLRGDTVRTILDGTPVDEGTASSRLGYPLRRHHLALRVSAGPDVDGSAEHVARRLLERLGFAAPLVIPVGIGSFDLWLGSFDPIDPGLLDAIAGFSPPPGVRLAVGTPAHDVDGFRRSHDEALLAARVAALADDDTAPVTLYERVRVAALASGDLGHARGFVRAVLGPLAVPDEGSARLRETLRVLLAEGGSSSRAAKRLYVHQNTVVNRVRRAEELLGHPLGRDIAALTVALELSAALGTAVLPPRA